MLFDAKSLAQLGVSKTTIARLERRQRGGESGHLRYVYQQRHALVRALARCDTDAFAGFVRTVLASRPATMKEFLEVLPR